MSRRPLFLSIATLLAVATLATVDDRHVVEPEPREPDPPIPEPPPTKRSLRLPEDDITIVHGPFTPNRELLRASLARHYPEHVAPDDRRALADASAKRARKAARRAENARRAAKV